MDDWTQRRDEGGRMTYPPLPTRGGNPNAEAPDGVVQGVVGAVSRAQQQEVAFRARQQVRRRMMRGMEPSPTPSEAPLELHELPDDPELDPYVASGWL